jgi:hypothetical protein
MRQIEGRIRPPARSIKSAKIAFPALTQINQGSLTPQRASVARNSSVNINKARVASAFSRQTMFLIRRQIATTGVPTLTRS